MQYPFVLPELDYDYDGLTPSIGAQVMELHHQKHHQGYVDKLNQALESQADLQELSLDSLISQIDSLPSEVSQSIRNNGGGHYNHSLFWQWMSPNGGGQPGGKLEEAIVGRYGSFQSFVDEFTTQALGLFGSGWVWLQPNMNILTTPNQDNPIMKGESAPILGLDVWEHAYYLDYKNVRADYVKAWWDVVDWQFVDSRLNSQTL